MALAKELTPMSLPDIGEAFGHLARELAVLEPVPDAGQDLVRDEPPDRIADRELRLGESAIDLEEIERIC